MLLGNFIQEKYSLKAVCDKKQKKEKLNESDPQIELIIDVQNQNANEDYSNAKYHCHYANPQNLQQTIQIKGLRKKYKNLNAVDGIDICMYESQIFCLLGHNGAGKTTTMNLLAGLTSKTEGSITFNGLSTDNANNLNEIHKQMGYCSQDNIFLQSCTVEQNLILMAKIRNITDEELIEKEVVNVLQLCKLENDLFQQAQHLSGGNKRKLCLALAIIGNSNIILLDEPTSGLDPVSRKEIGRILKKLRSQGKTIIFSTHHLEEAEFLGDRIAIMGKGKLLAVGDCQYIKQQFGSGYYLEIVLHQEKFDAMVRQSVSFDEDMEKNILVLDDMKMQKLNSAHIQKIDPLNRSLEKQKEIIIKLVKSRIMAVSVNPNGSREVISFLLPQDQKHKFQQLFQELQQFSFISINLQQNSLEEAFLNIGIDELKILQKSQIPLQLKEEEEDQDQIDNDAVQQQLQDYNETYFHRIKIPESILNQNQNITTATYSSYDIGVFSDALDFQVFMYIGLQQLIIQVTGASISSRLAREKQSNLKYVLNVMGCSNHTYYLGNMYFTIAYLGIFLGIPFSVAFPLLLINSQQDKADMLQKLSLIFSPTYSIIYGILTIIYEKQEKILQTGNQFFSEIPYQFPKYRGILSSQLYFYYIFIAQFFFYGLIFLWIERKQNLKDPAKKKEINKNELRNGNKDHTEIIQEELRVINENCTDAVQIKNLIKQYENGYTALSNVSFGVQKGEIFSLLGPAGSGKSTIFNILTATLSKTSGSVQLIGKEVIRGQYCQDVTIGICPQFDSLWPNLTVYQHLEIFGLVKGLTKDLLVESIDYYLEVLQMHSYKNVKAKKLSGGNKRKLCVLVALIGQPEILFLDEPSSGIDPISQRFLWSALTENLKATKAAILMTTHSMFEAESLSHKIGILINGRMHNYGTPEYLKLTYGEGYFIVVSLQFEHEEEVTNLIKNVFPEAEFKEQEQNELAEEVNERKRKSQIMRRQNLEQFEDEGLIENIVVQIPYEKFSFFKTFNFFDCLQDEELILNFQINQTTMEKIFQKISSLYSKDTNEKKKKQ